MLSLEQIRHWHKLPLHEEAFYSPVLGREQRFGWIAPEGTRADSLQRFPLLILLHGLNGGYHDWYRHTRIAKYGWGLPMVVVFPDAGNGWYTNGIGESERSEDALILDLIPHLQETLPILPCGRAWAIGGVSMGGYGALKLALKHTHLFGTALSHSGSLEKPLLAEPHPVFGDPVQDIAFRRKESLHYLVEQALCVYPTERPALFVDCGLQDELLEVNRRFRDHLQFLGFGHDYHEMQGHHTWPYWDRTLRRVLPLLAKRLGVVQREV
jgi:S-formylglutathione hydrolase FrmB